MPKYEIGMRVGAAIDIGLTHARFLGYGVYEGDFCPPGRQEPTYEEYVNKLRAHHAATPGFLNNTSDDALQAMYASYKSSIVFTMLYRNPRIKLDSGDILWGNECWWGEETQFKKKLAPLQISHWRMVRNDDGTPNGFVPAHA